MDENEKILLDLTSKEKNKEEDKLCSQEKTITFPATFLEWSTSSQAAGPANGKKDTLILPNPKDLMIKGKKDAEKRTRLLVTPKKGGNNPTTKLITADSSLGHTQLLDERGETIELEISFLNNDDEGPIASCMSKEGNMFVINCSEDNVESILLRVDSIIQDTMQNINDVASIMFLGIGGVSHVFENSLEVAANLELARRERI